MLRAGVDRWQIERAHERFVVEEAEGLRANSSLTGRMLSQAVTAFLKSQLDSFENLSIRVGGRNRELLGGFLQRVAVSASGACYKGLTVTSFDLSASSIQLSFNQQHSKRFLQESFPARVCISVSEKDLNASITSPLVKSALRELFSLPRYRPLPPIKVALNNGVIDVVPTDSSPPHPSFLPVSLEFCLSPDGRKLCLKPVSAGSLRGPFGWGGGGGGLAPREFDLGPGNAIAQLDITPHGVLLVGRFVVVP